MRGGLFEVAKHQAVVRVFHDGEQQDFLLLADSLTIGSGEGVDVYLPEPGVAARDCRIKSDDDGFLVEDLTGGGHLKLGDVPILKRARLTLGDHVDAGAFAFRLLPFRAEEHQIGDGAFNERDEPHGPWTYRYANGARAAEGAFKDGAHTGVWNIWAPTGERIEEATWRHGKLHGSFRQWFKTGVERIRGAHRFGLLHGHVVMRHDNGNLAQEGAYDAGVPGGFFRYFRIGGRAHSEGSYEVGRPEGGWRYFHEDGSLHAQGKFEGGRRAGAWTYFHEDGGTAAEGEFRDDQRDGRWREYLPDGETVREMEYRDGLRDGEFIVRCAGHIAHEGAYEANAPSGAWLRYAPDGARIEEGAYVDGRKEGLWQRLWPDGAVRSTSMWVAGKRHGPSSWWRRDGTLWVSGAFWRNARAGTWRRESSTSPATCGTYERGRLAAGDAVSLDDVDPGVGFVAEAAAARHARGQGPNS